MSDQSTAWDTAARGVAGVLAFIGTVWAYVKSRNTNHAERIGRLERQLHDRERTMDAVKTEIEELRDRMDIALASTNRRVMNMETNMRDTEREIRDSLQSIVEMLNRKLHVEPPRWGDNQGK